MSRAARFGTAKAADADMQFNHPAMGRQIEHAAPVQAVDEIRANAAARAAADAAFPPCVDSDRVGRNLYRFEEETGRQEGT